MKTMGSRGAAVLVYVGVILASGEARGEATRLGSEFRANSYTPFFQHLADVAMDPSGAFVIVWGSFSGQDGDGYGVFARRFGSNGTALAVEFQVNIYTPGWQRLGEVATDADGDFVVAWNDFARGIFVRRFNSAGTAQGGEFHVDVAPYRTGSTPDVAMEDNGDFVVVWQYDEDDPSEVFARRFGSGGGSLGSEFRVHLASADGQEYASVGMDADGDFVVAWQAPDANFRGVFARRFNSSGGGLGADFQVNFYTSSEQYDPSVGVDQDGDFVVSWRDSSQDGEAGGIIARRFASNGAALSGELQVNTYTSGIQSHSAVVMHDDGAFVVAWDSSGVIGSGQNIVARRFNTLGVAVGGEFQVNTYTPNNQNRPVLASSGAGAFLIVWDSALDLSPSDIDVLAQRFTTPDATLDVDASGSVGALTDGLLFLRHQFGFTGPTLINSAVDTVNCRRCEADAIADYLDSVDDLLDIDGSGATEALTDGLLALRFLFGFTGGVLVNGAINEVSCTRCTSPQLLGHLNTLL